VVRLKGMAGQEAEVIGRAFIQVMLGAILVMGLTGAKRLDCRLTEVANACAAGCYSAHTQCRMETKGASSCDKALANCLRGCNARR